MASGRKRWQAYADKVGVDLSELLNQGIRETLKVGVRAVAANTVQDSGRAAAHWVVIPNRGSVNPGSWKEMTFNPAYGRPPVGHPGDKGRNESSVIQAVVSRESRRAIDATVKGRKGQATAFQFQSNVPSQVNDPHWGANNPSNYRRNAELKEAKEVALTQMEAKWKRQIALGNQRKRPVN